MISIAPIKKIGKFIFLGLIGSALAFAGDVQFNASADRSQITLDESVSIKFSITAEGTVAAQGFQFKAPDFEVINEFSSTYVESYYENGKIGARNTQQVTRILKPLKVGTFKVSGIQATLNGSVVTAPDITVHVAAAGSGSAPPKGYGGSGIGLRGAGKRVSGDPVQLRVELSKEKVYRGEQVIVSYYLYSRVRVLAHDVEKFPVFDGFLREDLEIPVMGPRLDFEPVILDGVAYQRALLARYAAYPLQTGKLPIDQMSLKYNYYAGGPQLGGDDDDPFMNLFQRMTPRLGVKKSDPVYLDVIAVPSEGRPASYTGGVGDFTVSSAIDKYEVHANEAVTLKVKIEGQGNLTAIEAPSTKWPDTVELYDTKGQAKIGRAGVGEKVFEYLLIPRTPGKVLLPSLEFSFFDPAKKSYVTKNTEATEITVLDPLPGSSVVLPSKPKSPTNNTRAADSKAADIRGLKLSDQNSSESRLFGQPIWRWLYWFASAAGLFLMALIGRDLLAQWIKKFKTTSNAKSQVNAKSWTRLRAAAKSASATNWKEVVRSYELLSGAVFDALDNAYQNPGTRSLSRVQLEELLVGERGMPTELWHRVRDLLEFAELVRFATAAGGISESDARDRLTKWVNEGEAIAQLLAK